MIQHALKHIQNGIIKSFNKNSLLAGIGIVIGEIGFWKILRINY